LSPLLQRLENGTLAFPASFAFMHGQVQILGKQDVGGNLVGGHLIFKKKCSFRKRRLLASAFVLI
jgi:hypothetical protein